MSFVSEVEIVNRTAVLGVRFWDNVTGRAVGEGLRRDRTDQRPPCGSQPEQRLRLPGPTGFTGSDVRDRRAGVLELAAGDRQVHIRGLRPRPAVHPVHVHHRAASARPVRSALRRDELAAGCRRQRAAVLRAGSADPAGIRKRASRPVGRRCRCPGDRSGARDLRGRSQHLVRSLGRARIGGRAMPVSRATVAGRVTATGQRGPVAAELDGRRIGPLLRSDRQPRRRPACRPAARRPLPHQTCARS